MIKTYQAILLRETLTCTWAYFFGKVKRYPNLEISQHKHYNLGHNQVSIHPGIWQAKAKVPET